MRVERKHVVVDDTGCLDRIIVFDGERLVLPERVYEYVYRYSVSVLGTEPENLDPRSVYELAASYVLGVLSALGGGRREIRFRRAPLLPRARSPSGPA